MAPPVKPPAKGLPKWAWPAAIAGGLVIGFVFLRKGDGGAAQPAEVVGQLSDGSGFQGQAPPPQDQSGNGGDMASVLGALGLLGDQIGALQGSMTQYYGSGGTSQSGDGAQSGGGVVTQAQAESQAPASQPATVQKAVEPTQTETSYGQPVTVTAPGGWTATGAVGGAAGVGTSGSGGVVWGGQTFYTRAALGSWLAARGSNYQTWAANHPTAAAKLN